MDMKFDSAVDVHKETNKPLMVSSLELKYKEYFDWLR